MTALEILQHAIYSLNPSRIVGHVSSIVGLTLSASGLERAAGIGQRCRVHGRLGKVECEVVGARSGELQLLPYGSWDGVAVGDPVALIQFEDQICPFYSSVATAVDA